jgi:hypothetical protein
LCNTAIIIHNEFRKVVATGQGGRDWYISQEGKKREDRMRREDKMWEEDWMRRESRKERRVG